MKAQETLLLVPTAREAEALLGGPCPEDERPVASRVGELEVHAALTGFGLAAAGVLAALAVAHARPRRVVLTGVAGTFAPDRLAVGGVLLARAVRSWGIGRGTGAGHLGPAALGLPQAPGTGRASVHEEIALDGPAQVPGTEAGVLLSVAASAATPEEAAERRRRHPDALAEDMEAFAVALACRRQDVPLAVVRGITNVVGEGEPAAWDVVGALAPVAPVLHAILVAWATEGA